MWWLLLALDLRWGVLNELHLLHLLRISHCDVALCIYDGNAASGKLHVHVWSLRRWNCKMLRGSIRCRYLELLLWKRCVHELLLLWGHIALHLLWLRRHLLLLLLLRYHKDISWEARLCRRCRLRGCILSDDIVPNPGLAKLLSLLLMVMVKRRVWWRRDWLWWNRL